jgi:hypothetical protein
MRAEQAEAAGFGGLGVSRGRRGGASKRGGAVSEAEPCRAVGGEAWRACTAEPHWPRVVGLGLHRAAGAAGMTAAWGAEWGWPLA